MYPNALIKFNLFGKEQGVYLYGLLIGIGIIACMFVLYYYTKKKGMPDYVQDFAFICGFVAIAIGFFFAKVYQAVYDWIGNGFKDFDFKGAGITAMGGFIGGTATFILVYFLAGKFIFKGSKKGIHAKEFNKILTVAPCCITIAHAFGRIGCLMAGCCHGKFLGTEYVFGGIYMKGNSNGWGYYVPTQLYEAIFLFILFGVLTYLYFNRCNITPTIYLIAYGLWRFVLEFFRDDARGGFVLGLSPSQWQSFVFIIAGILIVVFYKIRKIPLWLPKQESDKTAEIQNLDKNK